MTESVDSKAFAVTFVKKIPYMILWGLTGAILGSGLYLLIALNAAKTVNYSCEKEYYIDFTYEWSKDYYNDYTWNDLMTTDLILGKAIKNIDGATLDMLSSMVEARVYSDVRYLTVHFTGNDKVLLEKLSEEMNEAIIEFANEVEEINSIRCIETGSVKAKEEKFFTFRAALLGAFLGLIIYIFVFCWKFSLLDAFYTRFDIEDRLGIEAKAVSELDAKNDILVNPLDGLMDENTYKDKKVILAISQGKGCRRCIEELMITARQKGINISGAVLVDCSKTWLRLYGIKNFEGVYKVK